LVEFSEDAIADLTAIRDWIAADNPKIAAEKSALIAATCELLDSFPGIGAVYADPLRHFTKELWIIFYRPTETGVYIYRIFDSRQDWRAQLF
jgi:plasmid stabilization system protein ParE